jgi:hypothetical protein
VTAYHLWDWKGKKRAFIPKQLPQPDKAIWEVCEQLANGSKHFEVYDTYSSVKRTKLAHAAFQSDTFQPNAVQVGHLIVRLEDEPAQHLGTDSIRVDVLAERLVEFWRSRL